MNLVSKNVTLEEGIRSKVYNNNDVFKFLILAHLSLASLCVGYSLNKPMMSIEFGQQHSGKHVYQKCSH